MHRALLVMGQSWAEGFRAYVDGQDGQTLPPTLCPSAWLHGWGWAAMRDHRRWVVRTCEQCGASEAYQPQTDGERAVLLDEDRPAERCSCGERIRWEEPVPLEDLLP